MRARRSRLGQHQQGFEIRRLIGLKVLEKIQFPINDTQTALVGFNREELMSQVGL